jgi:hypothetical protein
MLLARDAPNKWSLFSLLCMHGVPSAPLILHRSPAYPASYSSHRCPSCDVTCYPERHRLSVPLELHQGSSARPTLVPSKEHVPVVAAFRARSPSRRRHILEHELEVICWPPSSPNVIYREPMRTCGRPVAPRLEWPALSLNTSTCDTTVATPGRRSSYCMPDALGWTSLPPTPSCVQPEPTLPCASTTVQALEGRCHTLKFPISGCE